MDQLLRKAAERLVATTRALGRQIVYRRGSSQVSLSAATGKTRFEIDDGYGGVRIIWNDMDFLIACEDLILNGVRTLPQRNDIIETENGLRYEVVAPAGASEWEYADPYQLLIRVHTMAAQ